jgi:hypothetical protein
MDSQTTFGARVFAADVWDDAVVSSMFATALPLREVDENGDPVCRPGDPSMSGINGEAALGGFNSNGGLPTDSTTLRLGSLFPASASITVGQHFEISKGRSNSPVFLALDWSHSWQEAKNTAEVCFLSSCPIGVDYYYDGSATSLQQTRVGSICGG